jgi:uncharacterized protein YjeT (DUF2065 family)
MTDFLTAVGLLFVFEGLIYGGAPEMAKRMAAEVQQMPEATLRAIGFVCMVLGVGIVWLVRG